MKELEGAGWLKAEETRALIAALGSGACRFVGGAVRDTLLGRPVADVDLATTHTPEEVMRRLEAAKIKALPTGLSHGTVTAVFAARHFEITTLRHDVETYGRYAKVAFHDDWEADALRRDFTINALYCDAKGVLLDPAGGLDDLHAGRVRFIGDAAERIDEDALRILRFFRFFARFGKGPPDVAALKACEDKKGMLDALSVERIREELMKLLMAPRAGDAVAAMGGISVLSAVLPGSDADAFRRYAAYEENVARPAPLRRLLALQGRQRIAVTAKHLKLSNREKKHLALVAELASGLSALPGEKELLRLAYRQGVKGVCDALVLRGAEKGWGRKDVRKALSRLEKLTLPDFPVTGHDLMKRGYRSGEALGRMLSELEQRWVESDFSLGREELLKTIKS